MLPGEAEGVQPGRWRDAAFLHQMSALVGGLGNVDPGVVGGVSGCPHHGDDVGGGAVGEGDGPAGGGGACGLSRTLWCRARCRRPTPMRWSRPASRRPSRESTVTRSSRARLAHHHTSRPSGRCGIVGIRAPAESSTRVRRGELLRDLAAGVRGADHQHPARGERLGGSVTGAVHLVDVGVELVGDRGDERDVERSGGDHHLPSLERCRRPLGRHTRRRSCSARSPWCSAGPAGRMRLRSPAGSSRRRPCRGKCPVPPGTAGRAGCRIGPG